ncbi:MAG: tetratricopeptide repeat protein [Pirellula sp.]|nr:tetratricopeptide repeat protein [Pirellula sp.]
MHATWGGCELTQDKIESNLPNQPFVQAEILSTIGTAYLAIGGIDKARKAIDLFKRSFDLFQLHLGPDHLDTLTSIGKVALACHAAGQMNEALPLTATVRSSIIEATIPNCIQPELGSTRENSR